MPTRIEWTDETWNVISGCTPISAGCANCYAKRMSKRLAGRFGYPENGYHCPACSLDYHLLGGEHCPQCGKTATETSSFDVTFHADKLDQPLRWKKPRRVFVCSMGDLFHEDVSDEWIDQVFAVIGMTQRHTYQILTKRPERMLTYFTTHGRFRRVYNACREMSLAGFFDCDVKTRVQNILIEDARDKWWDKIFGNVHLGVTAENQEQADKRVQILLRIPAAVHFVSIEPMLGPIIVQGGNVPKSPDGPWPDEPLHSRSYLRGVCGDRRIDWVICGAETGPGKRQMDLNWARDIRDQCQAAGVPFFFKKDSDGRHTLDGRTWEQFPEGRA